MIKCSHPGIPSPPLNWGIPTESRDLILSRISHCNFCLTEKSHHRPLQERRGSSRKYLPSKTGKVLVQAESSVCSHGGCVGLTWYICSESSSTCQLFKNLTTLFTSFVSKGRRIKRGYWIFHRKIWEWNYGFPHQLKKQLLKWLDLPILRWHSWIFHPTTIQGKKFI